MSTTRVLSALTALTLAACLPEPGAIDPPEARSAADVCPGSTLTHIYASSITDIDDLAAPVGAMIWDSTVDGTLAGDRVCTVTMISPSLAITAGHCFDEDDYTDKGHTLPAGVSTPAEICEVTGVQFNYQYAGRGTMPPTKSMPTYACEELLYQEHTTGYDYALLRLSGAPGDRFGWHELEVDGHAASDAVTVISHPGGGTKKVAQGSIIGTNGYQVEHIASTDGGSSGAALLDDDGHILGIHTEGASGSCSATNGNYGWSNAWLRSDALVPFLRENEYLDLSPTGEEEASDRLGLALAVGDFDGDDVDDLAMGVPYHDYGTVADAGAVRVRYGTQDAGLDPTSDHWRFDTYPESGDRFGEVLAVGDFDDDGYDDLAVGMPREDLGSTTDAGRVLVFYGSSTGLSSTYQSFFATAWTATAQSSAWLGASLAVGDFDDDDIDDLAAGAYGQDSYAGVVYILTSDGTDLEADFSFDQGDTGVDTAESLDMFGFSLAAGDFDGDGADDLAIGAPFESYDSLSYAGQVTVVYGDASGLDYSAGDWHEMDWDTPSSYDRFGYALAAGSQGSDAYQELAISAPYWDHSSATDLGLVEIRRGGSSGLSTSSTYGLGQHLLPSIDAYDKTGLALAWGTFDDLGAEALAVGAPYDDEDGTSSGLVMVTSGEVSGSWGLDYTTADPEPVMERSAGDRFGWALAAGDFDGTGVDELAIGLPYADTDDVSDIGAVLIVTPWE